MSFIVDFYKSLDTVNLFIFWGVIVVVTLLLIFAIIISNKNKKLERIIASRGIDIDEFNEDDIPAIKKDTSALKNDCVVTNDIVKAQANDNEEIIIEEKPFFTTDNDTSIEKEAEQPPKDAFVAEEHVLDYQNKKIVNDEKDVVNNKNYLMTEEQTTPKPYQKNVLKEMSLNQTSPIGIVKNNLNKSTEVINAEELYTSLNEKNNSNLVQDKPIIEKNNDTILPSENNQYNNYKKGNYLEELSKNNSKLKEEINRTEYELRQEEDAIISYEELMKKKDNINIIDEEEAVISINELLKKKEKQEKLYNINNDEDNDEFIDELKNFRSDL